MKIILTFPDRKNRLFNSIIETLYYTICKIFLSATDNSKRLKTIPGFNCCIKIYDLQSQDTEE